MADKSIIYSTISSVIVDYNAQEESVTIKIIVLLKEKHNLIIRRFINSCIQDPSADKAV